jgi:hypothetical protein
MTKSEGSDSNYERAQNLTVVRMAPFIFMHPVLVATHPSLSNAMFDLWN